MEINNKGFTLVELVIVVGLTAILTIAITAIIMSSLLTSNRIRTLVDVRQSGSYAISQIEKMIRGAQSMPSSACTTANAITINNFDGDDTTFSLVNVGGVDKIASVSATKPSTYYLTPDGMEVENFSITCTPLVKPTSVKVSFTIKNISSSTRPFENASVDFQTSIRPRNN